MPFKMNSRSCERIGGLMDVLKGDVTMTMLPLGNQWYGGDVRDSSTRRVSLPDAFFATDGIFQTMLHVLDEGGFYPAMINREIEEFMPFLGATAILMLAVQHGIGRETAHNVIKGHSVAIALARRERGETQNDLIERLAQDERFADLSKDEMEDAIAHPEELVGMAPEQIAAFASQANAIIDKYPEARSYMPENML
jgi:adenylosuccinate lyase